MQKKEKWNCCSLPTYLISTVSRGLSRCILKARSAWAQARGVAEKVRTCYAVHALKQNHSKYAVSMECMRSRRGCCGEGGMVSEAYSKGAQGSR